MQELAPLIERRRDLRPATSWADMNAGRREMTLGDLWAILDRRKALFLIVFFLTLALTTVLFLSAQRLYRASASIQVQRETADTLALDTMMGQNNNSDSTESNINLQTEAQVLQSDSMAQRVIDALYLDNSPDFEPHFSPLGWIVGLLTPANLPSGTSATVMQEAAHRAHAVEVFKSRLKVKPIAGTRLITIDYYSSNPELAAQVVNTLVQNLLDYNFTTRHDATRLAANWLSGQLADLKRNSEDLNDKLVQLQHGSGLFSLAQTDAEGREQVYTPAVDHLQKATLDLSEAQSSRLMKGALYEVVKNGDPELISGLAGSALSSSSPGISSSLALIQQLRAQETQIQAQLAALSEKFGPSYPKIVEMKASFDTVRQQIQDEAGRIAARVKNDYQIAQKVEAQDRSLVQKARTEAESANDKEIRYEIVRQEAQQNSDLYQTMLKRMKEADLVAGLRSSNITIVDSATPQPHPAKPSLLLYLAAGNCGALIFAVIVSLLAETTDKRIRDVSDIESAQFPAPIALLPHYRPIRSSQTKKRSRKSSRTSSRLTTHIGDDIFPPELHGIAAIAEPRSAYAEGLRSLRTWIQRRGNGHAPQVITITSSVPAEGKSMLSLNLAIICALEGKRVLLIEGDLRTPVLEKRLGRKFIGGLTDLLSGEGESRSVSPFEMRLGGKFRLHVLAAGSRSAYPSELLASEKMEQQMHIWRSEFDHIILDAAPLLPVTDSSALARLSDFTIVVARHNVTNRISLARTWKMLHLQGIQEMGMVLNDVRFSRSSHKLYYGCNLAAYYGKERHA